MALRPYIETTKRNYKGDHVGAHPQPTRGVETTKRNYKVLCVQELAANQELPGNN
jgi:hypothetical protein